MSGLDLLWPSQREDVEFHSALPIALCCHEMGVGKTYIGCGLDLVRREQNPNPQTFRTLIFAPLSTHQGDTSSWKETYERVTGLPAFCIDPKARDASWDRFRGYAGPCAFIMHYEAARLMPQLQRVMWLHIVLDECQRISNKKALQTQAIKRLKTVNKTGLSGTPTTGSPEKFWSVLNWLERKQFSSYWKFFEEHTRWEPIIGPDGKPIPYAKKAVGPKNTKELLAKIAPFYSRRTRASLGLGKGRLPGVRRFVTLKPEQRAAYKDMKAIDIAWVKQMRAEHGDVMTPIMAQNAAVRIMRLQQFACAYATVEEVWRTIDGERKLVPRVRLHEPSTKLDDMMEILSDNAEEQFIVFSNFRQLIDLFEVRMQKAKIPYGLLTGAVPAADRGANIRAFQAGQTRVMAGTQAAGGVGVTLHAASDVVFLNRDWSPANNEQAICRADRAGQTRPVQVIDIVAQDTVDLSRIESIEAKWSWVLQLLGDIP